MVSDQTGARIWFAVQLVLDLGVHAGCVSWYFMVNAKPYRGQMEFSFPYMPNLTNLSKCMINREMLLV